MPEEQREPAELTIEELERQEAVELPDREAMSVINPSPTRPVDDLFLGEPAPADDPGMTTDQGIDEDRP